MCKVFRVLLLIILLTGCTNKFLNPEKNELTQGSQSKDIRIPNEKFEISNDSLLNVQIEETVTIMIDGQQVISNPENILTLVNKTNTLSSSYTPEELAIPNILFTFEENIDKRFLRTEVIKPIELLFAEAQKEGIELYALSGYRPYDRQDVIFQYQSELMGIEEARKLIALPGQSEHQLGLALDVTSQSADLTLTELFGETKEGKWLRENAYKFGFIIRYPLGKEALTGYQYEPWHIRYVGTELAEFLYKNDLVLDELFANKE